MLTLNNGHQLHQNNEAVQSQNSVTNTEPNLNQYEVDFLDLIKLYGTNQCIQSLKTVHDLALYHTTELCLSTEDIYALYCIKMMWEGLENFKKT